MVSDADPVKTEQRPEHCVHAGFKALPIRGAAEHEVARDDGKPPFLSAAATIACIAGLICGFRRRKRTEADERGSPNWIIRAKE
jgi:hypothetical protein